MELVTSSGEGDLIPKESKALLYYLPCNLRALSDRFGGSTRDVYDLWGPVGVWMWKTRILPVTVIGRFKDFGRLGSHFSCCVMVSNVTICIRGLVLRNGFKNQAQ
jgi:hypothetical protein